MKRRTIAVLTLESFIVFTLACFVEQTVRPELLAGPKSRNLKIVKLDTSSGESIVFDPGGPGRVRGDCVTGTGKVAVTADRVVLPKNDVVKISRSPSLFGETVYSVKTRDGKSYHGVKKIVDQGDQSVLYIARALSRQKALDVFSVPVSSIEKAWVKKFDPITTSLNAIVGTAAAGLVGFYLLVKTFEAARGGH